MIILINTYFNWANFLVTVGSAGTLKKLLSIVGAVFTNWIYPSCRPTKNVKALKGSRL